MNESDLNWKLLNYCKVFYYVADPLFLSSFSRVFLAGDLIRKFKTLCCRQTEPIRSMSGVATTYLFLATQYLMYESATNSKTYKVY